MHWFALSIIRPAQFHALMFRPVTRPQARRLHQQSINTAAYTLEHCTVQSRATQSLNEVMRDPVLGPTDEIICGVTVLGCSGVDIGVSKSSWVFFEPPLTSMEWLDVYATLIMLEMHLRSLEQLLNIWSGLVA